MKKVILRRPRFFYGWLIVGACLSMGIAHTGVLNPMLSLFMKPMGSEFGWSRAMFSAAVTIAALGGGLLSVVIGPLIDKRGPRIIMVLGAAIIGGCLAALSKVRNIWHFYALFGLARSVEGGATGLAIPVVVANWFIRERGRAMGIALAGTWVGGATLPLLTQWLIDREGWRFTWMSLGFLLAAIALIPAALFMRRRPEDMGLRPDGEVYPESKEAIVSSRNQGSAEGIPTDEPIWSRRAALATSAFWLLTLAEVQGFMVFGAVNMHQFPYLTDVGIPTAAAVGTISLAALLAGAGGLFWGFLAERIQPRYCLILVFWTQAASVFILMFAKTVAIAYVFAMVWGLSMGGMITICSVVWAEYFGRIALASVRGLSIPLRLIANASGPLLAGWAYDVTGSYEQVFIVIIVIFLVSSLWIFLSRAPQYSP